MARSFEEIQATGSYETDEERYIYLSELRRRGTVLGADAEQWLNDYEANMQQAQQFVQQPQRQQGQESVYNWPASPQTQAGTQLPVELGYDWEVLDRADALAAMQDGTTRYINELQRQTQMDIARLNTESARALEETRSRLQRELQAGTIDAEKFLQAQRLAQQESEFARNLALDQLIADRDNEIKQAQLELQKFSEIRQERELQAQLAANPQDFVAYEFYKRMLGDPTAWNTAQQFAGGEMGTSSAGNGPVTASGEDTIEGGGYPEAPPAYSDESLSTLGSSLFFGNQNQPYNQNLGGTGVFGTPIASPNQLSRAQVAGLSPSELGIMQSFLRGGIDMGGGKRTSIDPEDYFNQSMKSWIPTLASSTGVTRYR